MKLVIIEPLGVEEEKLMEIAHKGIARFCRDRILPDQSNRHRKPDRTWKGCGHYYGCKPAIECRSHQRL